MNLNSAALRLMAEKGLTLEDVAEIVAANEKTADRTNAVRQARHRAKRKDAKESNAVTVTPVTPPNDIDILTPRVGSETKVSSPPPWALPAGVSLQVWSDFLTNRKRKRLPNTPTAWKSFGDDLIRVSAETGIPPPKLIELCTAKGWGGIYDPREQRNERPNSPQSSNIGSTERAMQSALASIEGRGVGAGHPH